MIRHLSKLLILDNPLLCRDKRSINFPSSHISKYLYLANVTFPVACRIFICLRRSLTLSAGCSSKLSLLIDDSHEFILVSIGCHIIQMYDSMCTAVHPDMWPSLVENRARPRKENKQHKHTASLQQFIHTNIGCKGAVPKHTCPRTNK